MGKQKAWGSLRIGKRSLGETFQSFLILEGASNFLKTKIEIPELSGFLKTRLLYLTPDLGGRSTVAETDCVGNGFRPSIPDRLSLCHLAYAANLLAWTQLPMQDDRAWGLPQGPSGTFTLSARWHCGALIVGQGDRGSCLLNDSGRGNRLFDDKETDQ